VPGLRERLFGLADSGQPLIVDLNRVAFIDSAGLGVLVGAARRAAVHGGSLHAVCSRPQVRKLLWLIGVDRRIPLTATVDGALMLLTRFLQTRRGPTLSRPRCRRASKEACHDVRGEGRAAGTERAGGP
jgi:anti-anti-sigma factor